MTRERLTHFNVQMENIKCLIHKASSQKPDFGNFLQASSQQVIKLLTSSQAFVNWLARNRKSRTKKRAGPILLWSLLQLFMQTGLKGIQEVLLELKKSKTDANTRFS